MEYWSIAFLLRNSSAFPDSRISEPAPAVAGRPLILVGTRDGRKP